MKYVIVEARWEKKGAVIKSSDAMGRAIYVENIELLSRAYKKAWECCCYAVILIRWMEETTYTKRVDSRQMATSNSV